MRKVTNADVSMKERGGKETSWILIWFFHFQKKWVLTKPHMEGRRYDIVAHGDFLMEC